MKDEISKLHLTDNTN